MRTYIYFFVLCLSLYSFTISDGYERYQTFDEYQLKGVSLGLDSLKDPHVLVKEDNDTVWVRVSNHLEKEPVKYVNKHRYWYHLIMKIEPVASKSNKVMIREKYMDLVI